MEKIEKKRKREKNERKFRQKRTRKKWELKIHFAIIRVKEIQLFIPI